MLIALVSAKGSPGVTVSALGLASSWPRPVLLAECDPAGGSVGVGLLRGEAAVEGRGLFRVAAAARRGEDVLGGGGAQRVRPRRRRSAAVAAGAG